MDNLEIISKIYELINECNSPILNIYVRFYIHDKLSKSVKIVRSFGYKYKGVSFGNNLLCLLENNFHFNYFDFISTTLNIGEITCHGHGEYFGIDTLVITFDRS